MMTTRRQRRRLQRHRKALNHVRAMPGRRGTGDGLDRPVVGAGVVFGDPDDEAGHGKAGEAAKEEIKAGEG